ncbi:MAG: hypothetical protein II975_02710 [Bacteroidales bacterium]|nr:hypothetical protein [Bacteroidales bacterium]
MKRNKNILGAALLVAAVLMTGSEAFAQKKNDTKTKNSQSQPTEVKQDKDKTPQVVQFDMVDATKTYPEGNQITYARVKGLPTDNEKVEYMRKYVLEMMRVKRLQVYPKQGYILIDGDADIKPEHVVDVMNEGLERLEKERGGRPHHDHPERPKDKER